MISRGQWRWIGYAAAAVATAMAMAWVDHDDTVVQPVSRSPIRTPSAGLRAPTMESSQRPAPVAILHPRSLAEPVADPFESLPVAAAKSSIAAAPVRAPAEPSLGAAAPPLPFSYVGRWKENGRTTLYLQRDDKPIAVRGPGRIDAEYSVQSIDERGVVFTYMPLGTVQALRFDGASPAVPPGSTTAAAPVASEGGEKPSEN
jgi:hypothetical protein